MFDVKPWPDRVDQYLGIAAGLRPQLDALGGCEFIDRFSHLEDPAWLLSFQIWRDEASLVRWRQDAQHHEAQVIGRHEVFEDYRIRVGEVVRDETPGKPAFQISNVLRDRPYVVLTESLGAISPPAQFASLYRPGATLRVLEAPSFAAALDAMEECRNGGVVTRAWIAVVERDYGLFQRDQAPQAYPPVTRL
ncbi:MAG: antibiotic biosynthesis monooxygenase [Pseudomonadota bacterium]|nr:antibiotic biosynthesis monooxygenase [Pseudomonadota bacterium]